MITNLALRSLVLEEMQGIQIYRRELVVEYHGPNGPELITEGFKETAINAVQYLVAGAAEYGIALGTLGAGFAGPASAIETLIDAAFAAESITSTAAALTNIQGLSTEGTQIIAESKNLFSVLPRSLDEFYNSIKSIVGRVLSALGAGLALASERLKGVIDDLLTKVSDGIGKSLKAIIPDATIGLIVAEAIAYAISSAAENIYNLVKSGLQKAGKFLVWLLNPQNILTFFDQQYPQVISLFRQAAQKIGAAGVRATAGGMIAGAIAGAGAGVAAAAALKAFGPAGFNKLADWLTAAQPGVRAALASVVQVVMPFFMMFCALMQIMMQGDYGQGAAQQALGAAGKVTKITGKITGTGAEKKTVQGYAGKAIELFTGIKKRALGESDQRLQRIDKEIFLLESSMKLQRGKMRISESVLRRIVREEIESIEHGKRLIVQDDGIDEQELGGGYSMEFGAIPGATNEDDFQKIRLARMKASGASDNDAERMSRSKLKHRGQRAGRG